MNITIHVNLWYVLALLPSLVAAGFPAYAGILRAWDMFSIPEKLFYGLFVILPFGILDILLNITWGSLYYWDWPFLHGWTFSQRSCYWIHRPGDFVRYRKAQAVARQLNKVIPGHIS